MTCRLRNKHTQPDQPLFNNIARVQRGKMGSFGQPWHNFGQQMANSKPENSSPSNYTDGVARQVL